MFEQFPYADMQQLNLDWIIKIAKDFLDQYTQIQQIITDGLDQLDEKTREDIQALEAKKNELELLLDQWYAQHSNDIAQELTSAVASFIVQANQAAADAIASIPADYSALATNAIQMMTSYITNSNYSTVLPDANNAVANKSYLLFGDNILSANLPVNNFALVAILTTYKSDQLKLQTIIYHNWLYVRTGFGSTWNAWSAYSMGYNNIPLTTSPGYITNANYATELPDANNAPLNNVLILFGNNIQSANLPASNFQEGALFQYIKADQLKIQTLYYDGITWIRNGYADTWNAWKIDGVTRKKITVGANEQYTKLTDALAAAYARGNCDVYINAGTYDIFSELGSSFFSGYTFADTETGGGPVVGNGCTYTFAPNAYVVFNNTVNNHDVYSYFSPLNAGNGDFTIDGLNISVSNCRYAFHDETGHTGINNRKTIQHTFRNMNMFMDNSNNPYFTRNECIGGGLLPHGGEIVTIENCFFNGMGNDGYWVTYHNGNGGSNLPSMSKISITGCYFMGIGTIRTGSYGTNPDNTVVFITNCSLGAAPVNNLETPGSTVNITVYAWNNVIR